MPAHEQTINVFDLPEYKELRAAFAHRNAALSEPRREIAADDILGLLMEEPRKRKFTLQDELSWARKRRLALAKYEKALKALIAEIE